MEFEQLLKAAESEKVGKNLSGITKSIDSFNVTLDKLQATADKISAIFTKLGIPPHVLVRIIAQKSGIQDYEKPFEMVEPKKEEIKAVNNDGEKKLVETTEAKN